MKNEIQINFPYKIEKRMNERTNKQTTKQTKRIQKKIYEVKNFSEYKNK